MTTGWNHGLPLLELKVSCLQEAQTQITTLKYRCDWQKKRCSVESEPLTCLRCWVSFVITVPHMSTSSSILEMVETQPWNKGSLNIWRQAQPWWKNKLSTLEKVSSWLKVKKTKTNFTHDQWILFLSYGDKLRAVQAQVSSCKTFQNRAVFCCTKHGSKNEGNVPFHCTRKSIAISHVQKSRWLSEWTRNR